MLSIDYPSDAATQQAYIKDAVADGFVPYAADQNSSTAPFPPRIIRFLENCSCTATATTPHVMTLTHEQSVLKKMGLNYEMLDSGCCGMAGSFGFEASHYDVSVAVGERVLLPAVRRAEDDTLIIADGFSCREQIAGLTGRGALHLAQVLQMALHEGPQGPDGPLPGVRVRTAGQVGAGDDARRGRALAMGAGVLMGSA